MVRTGKSVVRLLAAHIMKCRHARDHQITECSRGIKLTRRMIASPRTRSTMTLPYSTRLRVPLTTVPMRSLNISSKLTVTFALAYNFCTNDLLGGLGGSDAPRIHRLAGASEKQSPIFGKTSGLRAWQIHQRDFPTSIFRTSSPVQQASRTNIHQSCRLISARTIGFRSNKRALRLSGSRLPSPQSQ